jgi:hypothetical protein
MAESAAMLIYIKQQHQATDLQVAMGVGCIVNWRAKGVAISVGWAGAPPQKILRTYPYPRPLSPKFNRHLKQISGKTDKLYMKYMIYKVTGSPFFQYKNDYCSH